MFPCVVCVVYCVCCVCVLCKCCVHVWFVVPICDFIFSIYAEQFGFIGVFLILILLGCFIVMTTLLTMNDKRLTSDLSPYYIGTYCTFVIGFSFLLNILMVSGLIPVVGLPLPFFTKGGSSLLCFSIMLGLIFTSRGFLK